MNVQNLKGSSDCSLFAIATATALAHGIPPETYWFDHRKMCQLECLEKEHMTPFPLTRERRYKETNFSVFVFVGRHKLE